ncbi:MAG: hypothetical protein LBL75_02220 [Rickettsiales bacterium]|jgi:hypothetical protein|nr:hypothetical protein [Rickettsiales bacterium]
MSVVAMIFTPLVSFADVASTKYIERQIRTIISNPSYTLPTGMLTATVLFDQIDKANKDINGEWTTTLSDDYTSTKGIASKGLADSALAKIKCESDREMYIVGGVGKCMMKGSVFKITLTAAASSFTFTTYGDYVLTNRKIQVSTDSTDGINGTWHIVTVTDEAFTLPNSTDNFWIRGNFVNQVTTYNNTYAVMFYGNTALKKIEGSFDNSHTDNKYVANMFSGTFRGCTNLRNVSDNIFGDIGGAPKESMFNATFYGDTNFTGGVSGSGIPSRFFGNISGAPAASMFTYVFYGCSLLTGSIPSDLFTGVSGTPASGMYSNAFRGCSKLSGTIPSGLFGSFSGAMASSMFSGTFQGCSSLTNIANAPFTDNGLTDSTGTNRFQNMYNGVSSATSTSPVFGSLKLWAKYPLATTGSSINTFSGATALSDYCQIPTNLGGSSSSVCVCPEGQYGTSPSCTPCEAGYKCTGGVKTACSGANEYQPNTGQSACLPVTAGYIKNGNAALQPCNDSTFNEYNTTGGQIDSTQGYCLNGVKTLCPRQPTSTLGGSGNYYESLVSINSMNSSNLFGSSGTYATTHSEYGANAYVNGGGFGTTTKTASSVSQCLGENLIYNTNNGTIRVRNIPWTQAYGYVTYPSNPTTLYASTNTTIDDAYGIPNTSVTYQNGSAVLSTYQQPQSLYLINIPNGYYATGLTARRASDANHYSHFYYTNIAKCPNAKPTSVGYNAGVACAISRFDILYPNNPNTADYRGCAWSMTCPQNSYFKASSMSCVTCSAGYYCLGGNVGQNTCDTAPSTFTSDSLLELCPEGYYCVNGRPTACKFGKVDCPGDAVRSSDPSGNNIGGGKAMDMPFDAKSGNAMTETEMDDYTLISCTDGKTSQVQGTMEPGFYLFTSRMDCSNSIVSKLGTTDPATNACGIGNYYYVAISEPTDYVSIDTISSGGKTTEFYTEVASPRTGHFTLPPAGKAWYAPLENATSVIDLDKFPMGVCVYRLGVE